MYHRERLARLRALFRPSRHARPSRARDDAHILALLEQMETPEGLAKVAARADPQFLAHTASIGFSRPC